MRQINFELKLQGIPEDKKFFRFMTTCADTIEKTQKKLLDAVIAKNEIVKDLPLIEQKVDKMKLN